MNFLLSDSFLRYKEGFCKFKKKYSYLRSLRFFENKNFAARATRGRSAKLADLWNVHCTVTPKNIPDQQKRVHSFLKIAKSTQIDRYSRYNIFINDPTSSHEHF